MRKLRKLSPLLQPDIRTRHEETGCGMGKGSVGDLVCSGLLVQDIGMFHDLVDQMAYWAKFRRSVAENWPSVWPAWVVIFGRNFAQRGRV